MQIDTINIMIEVGYLKFKWLRILVKRYII